MIQRALVIVSLAILSGCARPSPRSEPAAPASPAATPRRCDCGAKPLRSPAADVGAQRWG